MGFEYEIKKAGDDKRVIQDALDLVWRVFLKFEAPEYSSEGIEEFRSFIEFDNFMEMMKNGKISLWCCMAGKTIIGAGALRPPCHISLLFVEEEHQQMGIAKKLCMEIIEHCKRQSKCKEITVNSSPYAVEIYRRMGFVPTDSEKVENGIRYTPMKHIFKS